jgi:hypothetical protein
MRILHFRIINKAMNMQPKTRSLMPAMIVMAVLLNFSLSTFAQTNTPLQLINVGKNEDGRLELFAYAGNRMYYHRWQTLPAGNWTVNWRSVNPIYEGLGNCNTGGSSTTALVSGTQRNGALALFWLNGGTVFSSTQVQKNDNFSTSTIQRGGIKLRQIVTGNNEDGRLELFAIDEDYNVHHQYEDINGQWTPNFIFLGGGGITELAVGKSHDGTIICAGLGQDGSVYITRQLSPNGGWPQKWNSLGGTSLKHIAMANNSDGRIEIFAIGGDNQVWHSWETNTAPLNQVSRNRWSGWDFLSPGAVKQIVPMLVSDGRLFLFAVSIDGKILFQGQKEPNSGWVRQWNQFEDAHDIQQIAVGSGLQNSWEILALGGNGSVYRKALPPAGQVGTWPNTFENFAQPVIYCPQATPDFTIAYFKGAPLDPIGNDPSWIYIPPGETATLSWRVDNCGDCKISIKGMDGLNYSKVAFTASGLSTIGSIGVTPVETQTRYTLTVTSSSGKSKELSILVQLDRQPTPCTNIFYYKITCGSYCSTIAVCASSEDLADAAVKNKNVGCTVTSITADDLIGGCQ